MKEIPLTNASQFRQGLRHAQAEFDRAQRAQFPAEETLSIDLHCHDRESGVSDERIGRLLRCPETWVEAEEVRRAALRRGMDAFTITNHNNARSCFALLDRGRDVLVGAEFTCTIPGFDNRVHVLAYDFSPALEERLLKLRLSSLDFVPNSAQSLDRAPSSSFPRVMAVVLAQFPTDKRRRV